MFLLTRIIEEVWFKPGLSCLRTQAQRAKKWLFEKPFLNRGGLAKSRENKLTRKLL